MVKTSLPQIITEDIRSGRTLAGNDFTEHQIQQWIKQEEEACFEAMPNAEVDPWYAYMEEVNRRLGWSSLFMGPRGSMVVLGPGSGSEIELFLKHRPHWNLTLIEASEGFRQELGGKFCHARILKPDLMGSLSVESDSQDLAVAFSVLHHIPNVASVLQEISRVLKPGGFFMTREPCSSMGDWRRPRSATPNERGIAKGLLIQMAEEAGLRLTREPVPILFEPINKGLKRTVGFSVIPAAVLYRIDLWLSKMIERNDHYWRDTFMKKIGPSCYFYVFRKPPAS